MLLVTQIVIGVWEEFYFRGLVFNTLIKHNFSFYLAVLISSILFSIFHWSSFNMEQTSWLWYIGIIFLGFIFVYIYVIYNSIWVPVFFHFIWNVLNTYAEDGGLFLYKPLANHIKLIDQIETSLLFLMVIYILAYDIKRPKNMAKINQYLHQITK